jgi:hypothetical protein
VTRHRLVVFGRPRRWRRSRKEAQQEAVNAGLAIWDEHVSDRCYLGPGVEIESKP